MNAPTITDTNKIWSRVPDEGAARFLGLPKASHSSSLSNDFRLFTAATLALASPIGQAIPVGSKPPKGIRHESGSPPDTQKVPGRGSNLGVRLGPPVQLADSRPSAHAHRSFETTNMTASGVNFFSPG
jgi:hypothetical protein